MSTVNYVYQPSKLHLIKCEWDLSDGVHKYTFKFTGDVIDAYIACTEAVVWSKHPSFRITRTISKNV